MHEKVEERWRLTRRLLDGATGPAVEVGSTSTDSGGGATSHLLVPDRSSCTDSIEGLMSLTSPVAA